MDRLHRIGPKGGEEGYGWDEIKDIIDWIFDEDDFWPKQVRSSSGLRRNIIQIENQWRDYKPDNDKDSREQEILKKKTYR